MSTIRYATEADCQALGHINIHAFMSRGFGLLRNLFPQASWDSITPFKAAVSLKRLADPKMHVLVATDPETDSVVGYCRWTIPRGIGYDKELVRLSEEGTAAMEDPKQFAPQPMNEEVYKAFKRILEEKRKRHATEDDFVLDFLATLPAHQGQGIGTRLLRWGLDKANTVQRRVYLEATPEGYPLYIKYGWRAVEEVTIDFTEYGGEGLQTFVIMIRDPDTHPDTS